MGDSSSAFYSWMVRVINKKQKLIIVIGAVAVLSVATILTFVLWRPYSIDVAGKYMMVGVPFLTEYHPISLVVVGLQTHDTLDLYYLLKSYPGETISYGDFADGGPWSPNNLNPPLESPVGVRGTVYTYKDLYGESFKVIVVREMYYPIDSTP